MAQSVVPSSEDEDGAGSEKEATKSGMKQKSKSVRDTFLALYSSILS
jgi:hypothetical protein